MKNSTSRYEQETIINFNQEEDTATLYTASPAVYRRMVKRGFVAEDNGGGWRFDIPRKAIRLPSKPRVLTEKQKKVAGDRMRRLVHVESKRSLSNKALGNG